MSIGGRALHEKHLIVLKEKLVSYQTNPFSEGPAKVLCTGAEVDKTIIDQMLTAPVIDNVKYNDFVIKRLIKKEMSVFEPIPRNNLSTGLKKSKTKPKVTSLIKEIRQAFGLLIQ